MSIFVIIIYHLISSSRKGATLKLTNMGVYNYKQEICAITKITAQCAWPHNPTIHTWFAARKSICTIYYRLLGYMGKNKAKMAVSVAVEAKPEVEIWRRPKKSKEHW